MHCSYIFKNLLFKDIICKNFALNVHKETTFVAYFVELCTHIITTVSNNVQTQNNPQYTRGVSAFHVVTITSSVIGCKSTCEHL